MWGRKFAVSYPFLLFRQIGNYKMSDVNKLEIRYPNKFNEKYKTGYVYFETKTLQEQYIRDEFKYCKVEEKSYLTALYSNQRLIAVQNLYNKRIEFAKLSGKIITK